MITVIDCFRLYSKVFCPWEPVGHAHFPRGTYRHPKIIREHSTVLSALSVFVDRHGKEQYTLWFMMFSMGDAQKHSSSSTPPRRTTGRTIRVPRNRPGRHNGIPIHSCAIPTYLAAAPIAFTLDEYEALNSVSNRTAFTLNSPAHQVPFAIIPSSPIELGECGTKISSYHFFCSLN